jgi:rhamnosyltransferase
MKRLAIFAHWDERDRIKRYIEFFVRRLREECDEVAFVSTSKLPERELDKVRPYCAQTILKANEGFDFGMWKQVIDGADLSQWDELVLTNSSVFGPVTSLGSVFERMAASDADCWGMTDSNEIDWHLQSYFLVFRRRLLHSPEFKRFWTTVLPYKNKRQVIRSYEIGLTGYLAEHGFKCEALAKVEEVTRANTRFWKPMPPPRNPTSFWPVSLIERGMPFVKVEVLRDNPANIGLRAVRKALDRAGYDRSLVEFERRG